MRFPAPRDIPGLALTELHIPDASAAGVQSRSALTWTYGPTAQPGPLLWFRQGAPFCQKVRGTNDSGTENVGGGS